MPRITLSMPDEMKQKLDARPDINWSEIMREIIQKKVNKLKKMEKK